MKTYTGGRHCRRVRCEIETDLDHAHVRDCSIRRRRGALIPRFDESRFHMPSDWDQPTIQQFHTRQAKDDFCKTCGILPFRRPRTARHVWSVNVCCLEGVDLDALRIEHAFGSRLR
jgi:hypothetical protein